MIMNDNVFNMPVFFFVVTLLAATSLLAQDVDQGRKAFESRCARCHGADANGGEMGPRITGRLSARDDRQLATLIREGLPTRGMPPSQVADPEMTTLVRFLRTGQRRFGRPPVRMKIQMLDGRTLDGLVLG